MESAMSVDAVQLEIPVFGGGSAAALTVSQLSRHLKTLVTQDELASDVWVRGELSGVKEAPSGHWYFSLKDADNCLECVMWRSTAQRLRFELEPGAGVIVH